MLAPAVTPYYGLGMDTANDVLDCWPSLTAIAGDLAVDDAAVRMWRLRGAIPAEHFPALVRSAAKRDIAGITLEKLFEIRERAVLARSASKKAPA